MDNLINNKKLPFQEKNYLYNSDNQYPKCEISKNTNKIIKKKNIKNRCHHSECKKKLKLTDTECKCGFKYCLNHRMPETHNCPFNHKKEAEKILSDKLMTQKTVSDKIVKI